MDQWREAAVLMREPLFWLLVLAGFVALLVIAT